MTQIIQILPVQFYSVPALMDEKAAELKDEQLLGKLDPKDFFMSETFSDVVVECKGKEFRAHRIILAGTLAYSVHLSEDLCNTNYLPCSHYCREQPGF